MSERYILTLRSSDQNSVQSKVKILSTGLGEVEVFYGIDGRALSAAEYYKIIVRAYANHGQILTPSEVGCALSHLRMLEGFLNSNEQIAIIFEDDVLIREQSIEMLQMALEFVRQSDILVACSQQGADYPVRGLRLAGRTECYEVQKNDRSVVKRTCAYVVGRDAAKHILCVQNEGLWPADEFRVLCPDSGRLLLCNAFSHSPTNKSSNIENERTLRLGLLPPRPLAFRLAEELMRSVESKSAPLRRAFITRLGGYRVIGK